MRVDLARLRVVAHDRVALGDYVDQIMAAATTDDPPLLSDLIASASNGGGIILEALARAHESAIRMGPHERARNMRTWKLHVVHDEWGNPGQPGDAYEYRTNLRLEHGPGLPATSRELTEDRINGHYQRKWTTLHSYPIDERGCITCEFEDAVLLLLNYGVHPYSGEILSRHKSPHSADPVRTPGGQMLHVWYHRFAEADRDYYDKLPVLTRGGDKKRGG